jgi:sec-independent protein translocase protein TatC
MVMVRTGIIGVAKLKEVRPYVIVANFVVAAILTPPDVVSQFMLAIPMCLLYELGILFAGIMAKTGKSSADPAPNADPNKP